MRDRGAEEVLRSGGMEWTWMLILLLNSLASYAPKEPHDPHCDIRHGDDDRDAISHGQQ